MHQNLDDEMYEVGINDLCGYERTITIYDLSDRMGIKGK
jgi:ribosomal protein S25